jgi:hypothetical protein
LVRIIRRKPQRTSPFAGSSETERRTRRHL